MVLVCVLDSKEIVSYGISYARMGYDVDKKVVHEITRTSKPLYQEIKRVV